MKIERLLAITVLLLNRRRITARELAEQFEVSVRTIYRDVQTLNGAGIPVVSSQGHEGGLTIPENYKLSRQLLTFDDMVAVLTTLKGLNRTLHNKDIERVIEKITTLIPEEKERLYRTHAESFIIDITPWGMSDNRQDTLQTTHSAVSRSLLLQFAYTGAEGKESSRTVEPHTLIYKNFTWYLLAFCRTREAFRIFRLSRIKSLQLGAEHFIRREIRPLDQFFERDRRPSVEFLLRFAPKMKVKVEDYFSSTMLEYALDGSILASVAMPEDDWLLGFLLSFGSDVEVLSPQHWRKAIQEKCIAIQNIYTNLT